MIPNILKKYHSRSLFLILDMRDMPIFRLTFTLDDALLFLQTALNVTLQNETEIPTDQEIRRAANILYESSKNDPLLFTCFLMAYLRDRKTLDRSGYTNFLERDLNDKKRILDENQALWKPAIFCCIMGGLGIRLLQDILDNCSIYSNDLISLKNVGFLVKNGEHKIRHEIWAIEFLAHIYDSFYSNDLRSFNSAFEINNILKCGSTNMNVSELITMLDRCSLLLSEKHYENIAKAIVESFITPENLSRSDITNLYCFGIAKFYSVLKEYAKAIEYFDKALNADSKHIPSLLNKGELFMKLGEPGKAMNLYDQALKGNSTSVEALYNKGNALLDLNDPCIAINCYDKALELEPNYSFSYMNKGIALNQLGITTEALDCYNRALEIDHMNDRAWLNKGNVLFLTDKPTEALDCYNRALEINANEPLSWYNKGRVYYEKRDYDEALRYYDKALELEPSFANIWVDKLNLLQLLGRSVEALQAVNEALEYNSDSTFLLLKCYILTQLLYTIRNNQ